MHYNEKQILWYLKKFDDDIRNDRVYVDRTGIKFVEAIGATIVLDPLQKTFNFGVKTTNLDYCRKEMTWYDSQDRSITMMNDIKMWREVASKDGKINSNYGWCCYSKENYNQFDNVINELINNEYSRRAIMIFTRPSMWEDWNKEGMNDFMCTNYFHFFIRNNQLMSIYNIRSNDTIWGLFNDWYFAATMYERVFNALIGPYPNLEYGTVLWQASSLHVYERHFELVKKMVDYAHENQQKI